MTSFDEFVQSLSAHFDPREAQSMARIVFEDCFDLQRAQFATVQLSPAQSAQLQSIHDELLMQKPLQYILGQADYYGLKFKVDSRVLIPRPETEELVEWVLEVVEHQFPKQNLRILDIGTGSGCIPIVLQKKLPKAEVWGLDVSAGALALAQENAALNQVMLHWCEQDILNEQLWPQLPTFDLIISNPPYIPFQEQPLMPLQVTNFEPHLALFVEDADPLLFYRVIGKFAQKYLNAGGSLFFECNEYNAQKLVDHLNATGWSSVVLKKDLSGKDRMIQAVR